jgi:hypothetical protein
MQKEIAILGKNLPLAVILKYMSWYYLNSGSWY